MCSLLAGDGMNIPDILSINAGQWYILAWYRLYVLYGYYNDVF